MKILHVAPNAPYNDNWGYQDNLLPRYQKKMGHEVSIIVPTLMHQNGTIVQTAESRYYLDDGVEVIRKNYNNYLIPDITELLTKMKIYDVLVEKKPDFIFFHGLISSTIFDVIEYKRKVNRRCIIVEDNHLDYNIGSHSKGLKLLLGRGYFRWRNRATISYISKVYGVTPWRKKYAEEYFRIPSEKTDVLIMGADDEKIDFQNKRSIREAIRNNYRISPQDFLIVTGGKIDKNKKIHILMNAVAQMKNVKLLIFGQVADDIRKEFDRLLKDNDNIEYIGWIDADEVYNYFFAADLVCFPGQHSVLWEQACASKVPCLFERWEGMEHVDNGGNSDFLNRVTEESIREKITELCYTEKYYSMKRAAESDLTDIYLYSKIAEKSLECAAKNEKY